MSVNYTGVQWNRHKKLYDGFLLALVAFSLLGFSGVSILVNPAITIETLLIRATAVTAFLLLHVILCIGPLARLDRRFLPLLFNRRHLGVTMFLLALTHATASVWQFHTLAPGVNPLVSVFTAYATDYRLGPDGISELAHLPFEPFGAMALAILFVMAATSHDFWLRNLGASIWKMLHLGVFVAYGLLVAHVAYGVIQSERSPIYPALLGLGLTTVLTLHVWAARREIPGDRGDAGRLEKADDGFVRTCRLDELEPDRGKRVFAGSERVALYLTAGRLYGLANVCRHQGGPIGEGRIIDGCVTCPWHGWQYRPETGASPPPFTEVVETYRVRVDAGWVLVDPRPCPLGTHQEGWPIETGKLHS